MKRLTLKMVSLASLLLVSLIFAVPAFAGEIDDMDPTIKYEGQWSSSTNDKEFGEAKNKTIKKTSAANASVEVKFNGTSVQFYSRTGSGVGIFDIYIDGKKEATIDGYAATAKSNVVVFEKKGLTPGEHTFKVVNTGKKNDAATATNLFFDAIVFEEGAVTAPSGINTGSAEKPAPVANPKTGDTGLAWSVSLFAISVLALGVLVYRKRLHN